jgi:hypothetical protein
MLTSRRPSTTVGRGVNRARPGVWIGATTPALSQINKADEARGILLPMKDHDKD